MLRYWNRSVDKDLVLSRPDSGTRFDTQYFNQ